VSGKTGSSELGVGVELSPPSFVPPLALELEQPAIAVITPAPASAPASWRNDRRPRVLFECCASVEVEFMSGMNEIDREQRLHRLSDLHHSSSGPNTHTMPRKELGGCS